RLRQPVVTPSALARLFDPSALNPPAFLEAIQERVERRDAEGEDAAGPRFDQLAELVAMARLRLDEREDQQFRAAFLELAIVHRSLHMSHCNILLCATRRVKGQKRCHRASTMSGRQA